MIWKLVSEKLHKFWKINVWYFSGSGCSEVKSACNDNICLSTSSRTIHTGVFSRDFFSTDTYLNCSFCIQLQLRATLYSFELIFGGNENKFICFWEFLSFNWCLLVWILKLLVLLCSLIDIRKFVKTHSRFYNSPNNISKSNMFRQVQTKGSDPIVSPQLLSSIPCQFVMKTR